MKFSNFKVATRLAIGFGVLLLASLVIGAMSWVSMSRIEAAMTRLTTLDVVKARLTMEMEGRTRDNAAKTLLILMAGDDAATVESLSAQIAENSKANSEGLEKLTALVYRPEGKRFLAEAAEAREKYMQSRRRVMDLAKDARKREEAVHLFESETAGLLEQYVLPFRKLKELQDQLFEESSTEAHAAYKSAQRTIVVAGTAALLFGIVLSILLTRSITRPLRNATCSSRLVGRRR